jgi:hypothetical protein
MALTNEEIERAANIILEDSAEFESDAIEAVDSILGMVAGDNNIKVKDITVAELHAIAALCKKTFDTDEVHCYTFGFVAGVKKALKVEEPWTFTI